MDNKIPAVEVKRYFLLANAGKKLFKMYKNKIQIDENYNCIFEGIFELKEDELNEKITDKARLARYNNFEWYRGQKKLEDIGPWPKMASLDIRLTTGNILDTAQFIRNIQNGSLILPYSNIMEKTKRKEAFIKFFQRSESIINNLDFVYEKFPIILFPGGEIREKDYNEWARKNNEPLCKIFEYDLDD